MRRIVIVVGTAALAALGCGGRLGSEETRTPRSIPKSAEDALAWRDVCVFVARVNEIAMLLELERKALDADVDPRWGVVVSGVRDVKWTAPGVPVNSWVFGKEPPIASDDEIVYAIHSPAKMFARPRDKVVGKEWRFKMSQLVNLNGEPLAQVLSLVSVSEGPIGPSVPFSLLVPKDDPDHQGFLQWWEKGHDLTQMTWRIRIKGKATEAREVTAAEYVAPFFEPLAAARLRLRAGEFAEAIPLLKKAKEIMTWMPYPPGDGSWVRLCDGLIAAASARAGR